MEVIQVKSQALSETRDSYSRVVMAGDWAFVSITPGINFGTNALSSDPAEQAGQMIDNVAASLAEVGCALADVIQARTFIPHQVDFPAVLAVFADRFRGIDPAHTVICTPLGSPALRVEMEATAIRDVGKLPQGRRTVSL